MYLLKDFLKPISKSKLESLGFNFSLQKKGLGFIKEGELYASTTYKKDIIFHKMDSKMKEIVRRLNLSLIAQTYQDRESDKVYEIFKT